MFAQYAAADRINVPLAEIASISSKQTSRELPPLDAKLEESIKCCQYVGPFEMNWYQICTDH